MRQLADFHHYNARVPDSALTRLERLERRVIATLLAPRALGDDKRDSSIAFELKHSSGTMQFARALARKRSLDLDTAAAGALLHDVYVIEKGSYKNHAALGAPIARDYMDRVGGFTEQEISNAERLVANHSDKHIWSDDPYSEFGKDVDVLDCFLYPGAFDYYLLHKPYAVFVHYLKRAKRMWSDLNLPAEPIHTLLDEYEPQAWMPVEFSADQANSAPEGTDVAFDVLPPYVIFGDLDGAPNFRAPSSKRTDQRRIVDHARTVVAQIDTATRQSPILVFPALERWRPLTRPEELQDLGGDELLLHASSGAGSR